MYCKFRCACTARNVFRCRVWNEIESGEVWSDFYRSNNKPHFSELISDVVDLTNFLPDPVYGSFFFPGEQDKTRRHLGCESCTQSKVAEIYKMVNNIDLSNERAPGHDPMMTTGWWHVG